MIDEDRIREIVREELAVMRAKPAKGHRLAADFTMPDEWLQWARDKRFWSETDAKAEGELFCDYWTSRGGVMVDWRKCWQTWVRNSRRPDGVKPLEPVVGHSELAAHYERTAKLYDRLGRTQEAADLRSRIGA